MGTGAVATGSENGATVEVVDGGTEWPFVFSPTAGSMVKSSRRLVRSVSEVRGVRVPGSPYACPGTNAWPYPLT